MRFTSESVHFLLKKYIITPQAMERLTEANNGITRKTPSPPRPWYALLWISIRTSMEVSKNAIHEAGISANIQHTKLFQAVCLKSSWASRTGVSSCLNIFWFSVFVIFFIAIFIRIRFQRIQTKSITIGTNVAITRSPIWGSFRKIQIKSSVIKINVMITSSESKAEIPLNMFVFI